MNRDIYQKLSETSGKNCLIATMIDGEGTGSRALFADGSLVEKDRSFPENAVRAAGSADKTAVIETENGKVFAELLGDVPRLIVCGCGHVGLSVVRLGVMLGMEVIACDDRPAFTKEAELAGASLVLAGPFTEMLGRISPGRCDCCCVMTRGHRYDLECLRVLLKRNCAYLGVMSSRGRAATVRNTLLQEGFTAEQFAAVHAPIGIKIGAETPEEIAVSVLAEIISVNSAKKRGIMPREIRKALTDDPGMKEVYAEVVERRGSAPRDAGAKMIAREDGTVIGTIGGGCMEAEVLKRARRIMQLDESPQLVKVDLTGKTDGDADGMACGGIMEVFLEPLE